MARLPKREGFSLNDFKRQLASFARPGIMQRLLNLLPWMWQINRMLNDPASRRESNRLIGMIDSMTPHERSFPKVIERSRRLRIAKGAGVSPKEVSGLVKQFESTKRFLDDRDP